MWADAISGEFDERLQDAAFVALVHAAADRERQVVRAPGRPRKAKKRAVGGSAKAKGDGAAADVVAVS